MPGWAAFAGLTALLVALLLVLARLSQGTVSDAADALGAEAHPRAPVVPRFEESPSPRALPEPEREPLGGGSTALLFLNVLLTHGLFGTVLAAGVVYFGVPLSTLGLGGGPLASGLPGVAVGVAVGVALWLGNEAAGVAIDAAGLEYDDSVRSLLTPDGPRGWLLLLGGAFPTVALVEEFVFRAAAVGALAAGLGVSPWILAVVSAVAFGFAHGAQGQTGVVVTGALGFALAAAFVLTQSLLVVAVAHYLVNSLELVVHEGLGVSRPGMGTPE